MNTSDFSSGNAVAGSPKPIRGVGRETGCTVAVNDAGGFRCLSSWRILLHSVSTESSHTSANVCDNLIQARFAWRVS